MTTLKTWPIVVGTLIGTLGSIGVGVLYFVGIFGLQIARGAPASDEPFGTPHLIVTEIVAGRCTQLTVRQPVPGRSEIS